MSPPGPPPRPPRKDDDQHPAERGATPPRGKKEPPPNPRGKHFEIRKGRAPGQGGDPNETQDEEEDGPPPAVVALPRSITQEQEEADLKRRLNREELIEINKRHAAVKLVGAANEPEPLRRKSSGVWLLIGLVVLAGLAFAADRFKLLEKLGGPPPQAPPK